MTILASCLTDYGQAKEEVQERGKKDQGGLTIEDQQDIAIDLDNEDGGDGRSGFGGDGEE